MLEVTLLCCRYSLILSLQYHLSDRALRRKGIGASVDQAFSSCSR